MNTSPVLRTPLLALSFICMSAQAEWRCDCTTILDTCSATVTVEDDWVSIESDHRQCARVDYLVDGVPFVALVVEGRERQSWLSRNDNPRVLMQSCKVCLDNADARAPVSTPWWADGRARALARGRALAVAHRQPAVSVVCRLEWHRGLRRGQLHCHGCRPGRECDRHGSRATGSVRAGGLVGDIPMALQLRRGPAGRNFESSIRFQIGGCDHRSVCSKPCHRGNGNR